MYKRQNDQQDAHLFMHRYLCGIQKCLEKCCRMDSIL